MTQQEKRIKLAEFDGWKPDLKMIDGSIIWDIFPDGRIFGLKSFCSGYQVDKLVPDYFNDLNSVRELEQKLYKKGLDISDLYLVNLYEISQDPHICNLSHTITYVSATAEQRCEALAKTLNLW